MARVPRRINFAGDNPWFLGIARRGNRMAFTRLHRDINIYHVSHWRPMAETPSATLAKAIIASSRRDDTAYYSPDGSHITFASNRTGPMEIWIAQADGKDPVQLTNVLRTGPTLATRGGLPTANGSPIAASPRPMQRLISLSSPPLAGYLGP